MIYKPDRVARLMKELLVLLEDELHAREINLEILSNMCAGLHKPIGATVADKILFLVAAMAAEMERDLTTNTLWTGWPPQPPKDEPVAGPVSSRLPTSVAPARARTPASVGGC